MTRTAKVGIACLMLLATGLPSLAATNLAPKDIQTVFGTGSPFNGVAVPGGRRYSLTLNSDGTAQMTLLNDKSTKTGTWKVSQTGYCSKWGDQPQHCYTVEQSGKGYDVLDASAKVIAHWTKP